MVWYNWLSWAGLVLAGIITLVVAGCMVDVLATRWIRRQHYKSGVQEISVDALLRNDDVKTAILQLESDIPETRGVIIIAVRSDSIKVSTAGIGVLEMPTLLGVVAEECIEG